MVLARHAGPLVTTPGSAWANSDCQGRSRRDDAGARARHRARRRHGQLGAARLDRDRVLDGARAHRRPHDAGRPRRHGALEVAAAVAFLACEEAALHHRARRSSSTAATSSRKRTASTSTRRGLAQPSSSWRRQPGIHRGGHALDVLGIVEVVPDAGELVDLDVYQVIEAVARKVRLDVVVAAEQQQHRALPGEAAQRAHHRGVQPGRETRRARAGRAFRGGSFSPRPEPRHRECRATAPCGPASSAPRPPVSTTGSA